MKINHVLVTTGNLEKMGEFLTGVVGLEKGHRPPFRFPGEWFYSEGKALLHVVEDKNGGTLPTEILEHHIALEGENYHALMRRINDRKIKYGETEVPLTQERQVFVTGIDGLSFEFIFPMEAAQGTTYNNLADTENYRL